jgi:hypothetical protein
MARNFPAYEGEACAGTADPAESHAQPAWKDND